MPICSTRSTAPTAFGEIAARASSSFSPIKSRSAAPHRTGQPVRRASKEAGTFEEQFFLPRTKDDTNQQYRAVKNAADEGKALRRKKRAGESLTVSERLVSRITPAAVRIYEEITDLARINNGRVFPTYDHIARVTNLVHSTISAALTALENIGAIERQRRFVKVERDGMKNQYRQTSTAYRTFLPKALTRFLPRWMRTRALPADVAHHEAERVAETDWMLKSASCVEYVAYLGTEHSELRRELARLGASVDRCDFDQAREPHINSI